MAVKIRLTRIGKKKQPSYRVVVADSRSPRDGRYIEQIGRYDPRQDPSLVEIDDERATYWLSQGAQPSAQVRKLIAIARGTAGVPKAPQPDDPRVHVVGEEAQLEAEADDETVIATAAEAMAEVVEEAPAAAEPAAEETPAEAEPVAEEATPAAADEPAATAEAAGADGGETEEEEPA
jgi:small subunit ribosomal protein S16